MKTGGLRTICAQSKNKGQRQDTNSGLTPKSVLFPTNGCLDVKPLISWLNMPFSLKYIYPLKSDSHQKSE